MLSNQDKGARVKQIYSDLNRKFEEQETERQAQALGVSYINLYGFPVDSQALSLIPETQAQTLGTVVFFKEGNGIKVGSINPGAKIEPLLQKLRDQHFTADVFLISHSSLHHLIESYRKILSTERHSDKLEINTTDKIFASLSLQDLAREFSQASATEMIEVLLGGALKVGASDVHIEPSVGNVKIRYRIDGVLQDIATLPTADLHQVVSRIKILSKTKLNITNTPQDGSFSLTFDGTPVDIRVSILPSAFGESIVMRILRQDKDSLKFEELGIMGLAKNRILKEIQKPNGMVLTTGPTGSGKTTTLYAILNKLNEPGVKIITLEDPVEYKIPGITQSPIDTASGLTFAGGLRAILRQDPDIVMVGEMRDLETAEIACQAALTGHIVLSTLHTNDATSAIPRLLDLGIRSFVVAPAINAIIGQRLVRKICPACKQAYKPAENLLSRVQMILQTIPKASQADVPKILNFYHSPGCAKCNGLGYQGRMGVYEVFTISDEIEKLVGQGASNTEIKKQAIAEGMLTMAQDGILKALQGITDIEEVFRVTEE